MVQLAYPLLAMLIGVMAAPNFVAANEPYADLPFPAAQSHASSAQRAPDETTVHGEWIGPGDPTPGHPSSAPQGETLEEAWQIALASHPLIQARRCLVASAEHQLQAAKLARMPQVDLATGYTVRDREPGFRFDLTGLPLSGSTFPSAQKEALLFGAEVHAPLFTGGRIRHAAASASADKSAIEADVRAIVMEVKLAVATAYANVAVARETHDAFQQTVASLDEQLDRINALTVNRQGRPVDALAAEAALLEANQQLMHAQNQLDIDSCEYNRLLQRPFTSPVRLALSLRPPAGEDVEELTQLALAQRPELARLEQQAQSLRERALATRAEKKPQLEVRAHYEFEENRYRDPQGIAAVLVGVEWKTFDGGQTRHRASALEAESSSLQKIRDDLASQIRLEVRRAWLETRSAGEMVRVRDLAKQRADEELHLVRQRYAAGMVTNSAVLDAIAYQAQASRAVSAARGAALVAAVRLLWTAGDL